MDEALIIAVSSLAGAFIVWFFIKKSEAIALLAMTSATALAARQLWEVVALKVKIAKLEQQIEDQKA